MRANILLAPFLLLFARPSNGFHNHLLLNHHHHRGRRSSSSPPSGAVPAAAPRRRQQPRLPKLQEHPDASSGSTESSSSGSGTTDWDAFDYLQHWYPVSWVCDLRPQQPTKVTLFDVDYVVAVDFDGQEVIAALRNVCPHKGAALSEGRVIPGQGCLQCAYHGWSFDGTTGACREIPQSSGAAAQQYSGRTSATAVPAAVHQGLLWLWPGNNALEAAAVAPPSIPEMDDPDFRVLNRVVRDFPAVDWTLLCSNILDPDHGLFAHQATAFDWYSADPEHPVHVKEAFPRNGAGWRLESTVPAVEKLLRRDKAKRAQQQQQTSNKSSNDKKNIPMGERILRLLNKSKSKTKTKPLLATSVFEAPTTIALFRREESNDSSEKGEVKFVTAFWVCPVGTGRSRFFSAAVAKNVPKWIRVPRWLSHVTLNNFLDQDTVLVASQQAPVLSAEAAGRGRSKAVFAYASPTDRAVSRIDQFWDATVGRAPNRAATLRALARTGQLRSTPDRSVVLDREAQHLKICPDSQAAVRNLVRLRNAAAVLVAAWVGAAVKRSSATKFWPAAVAATLVGTLCERLRKEFYFNYPEWKRDRDLQKIPAKTWLDPK